MDPFYPQEEKLIEVACRNAFVQTDSEYLQKARDLYLAFVPRGKDFCRADQKGSFCLLDSCSLVESRHLNDGSTGLVALLAHGFEDEGPSTRSLVEGRKIVGCCVRTGKVASQGSGARLCSHCPHDLARDVIAGPKAKCLGLGAVLAKLRCRKRRPPKSLKAANPVAARSSSWQTAGIAGPCSSVGARRSA